MSSQPPINIVIAFSHHLHSEALKFSLEKTTSFIVKACVKNVVELVQVINRSKIDIVLIDNCMPMTNNETIIRLLQSTNTCTKVIVLGAEKNQNGVVSYLKNSPNTCLSKDCNLEELTTSIKSIHDNSTLSSTIHSSANTQFSFIHKSVCLSKRELEIVKLVCQEKCNTEIADILNISLRTIENHRYRISKKIGAKSGIGFFVYSLINGHIQLSD
jgi:DNA-binding NarL/FixJ family response regulator